VSESSLGRLLLLEAAALLESGWCQGAEARDDVGEATDPWNPEARSWSLLGAIVAVLEREAALRDEIPFDQLSAALVALAHVVQEDVLVDWNDAPGRSQQEVVLTVNAAAARCTTPLATSVQLSLN
jgi:hypothetical protein